MSLIHFITRNQKRISTDGKIIEQYKKKEKILKSRAQYVKITSYYNSIYPLIFLTKKTFKFLHFLL